MAIIDIPYGRGTQKVHVSDSRLAGILTASESTLPRENPSAIVLDALVNPIGSPRLSELARGKRRILVITSDHTRPMPSGTTLPLLLEEIRAGSPDSKIRILIATGMHRAMTRSEQMERFGADLIARETIIMHQSDVDSEMAYCGQLPSGGELWLNKLVLWAELVVAEGFIEPHFFAGYSGGRKSILPGVASRKTVLYNHNAQFIADPRSTQGSLVHNPVHQDMAFAAKVAKLSFILNVLLDAEKRIASAYSGDPEKAHTAGCEACENASLVARAPADIVITSNGGYPLDQNLYQAVKGMTAAEQCVRPGGVIIMCAEMADGHGGEAFYRWFADREGPGQVLRDIENIPASKTLPDQWQAQILARVLLKARCIFVTGAENRALVESMHMMWAPNPNDALALAIGIAGDHASVTVIPNGVGVIVA
jgi:nickel-dependent lactate racemase